MMIWALGFNPTEQEVVEQMNIIDKAQTGSFDQNSFISLIARLDIKNDTLEELIEALIVIKGGQLDEGGKGEEKLGEADLKYSLTKIGEPMHEHEIDEILKDLDAVYDGKIYIKEFA